MKTLLMMNVLLAGLILKAEFVHPLEKLKKISSKSKQMWVVIYSKGTTADALTDIGFAKEGGADAAIVEGHDVKKLDEIFKLAKEKFPKFPLGANFLGPDDHLYTYKETFGLVKKHKLQIAWTDFSGVDLIKEAPEVSLHSIEAERPDFTFYISGIHMKYSTLLDQTKTLEKSALQAMGWVDGIIVTGPKTGMPSDPDRVKRVREVIGNYPLGVASGTSAENVGAILKYINYVVVNSSIADKDHRIILAKVKELREALDK